MEKGRPGGVRLLVEGCRRAGDLGSLPQSSRWLHCSTVGHREEEGLTSHQTREMDVKAYEDVSSPLLMLRVETPRRVIAMETYLWRGGSAQSTRGRHHAT